MLLLSGVVLTLGFVVMGTTLIQLHGLEGSTERTQRDSLMDTAEELIASLNQTIRDSIVVGETNITSFQETLRNAEASLRDNAVRSGVYTSVELSTIPVSDPQMQQIFWRESRCIGYNPSASQDGVIVGWEAESFEESFAGAIYDIHITDGRQSFRSLVYVKIIDCAEVEITSQHTAMGVTFGHAENSDEMRTSDGVAANFTEELDMDTMVEVFVHPTIQSDTIDVEGWNNEDSLLALDGSYTHMPSRASSVPAPNWFRFQLDPPDRMKPDDTLPDVTLEITGYKDKAWSALTPQNMYLRVYPTSNYLTPLIDEVVPLPVGSPGTVEIVLDNLQPLAQNWSYDDIVDSYWELTVFGVHQPSQHYNVDHFNMTGSMLMAQGHRLNLSMDWQNIPGQYENHELNMRYRLDPATPEEGFELLVRDREETGSPWTFVHNMTDTMDQPGYCADWDDGWCTVTIGPGEVILPNQPEFRIVDTIINDNWVPEDEDTLEIDHLYITSHLADYN